MSTADSTAQKILLVEDEPDVREAFAMSLEDDGLHVLQAESAEDGLEILLRERVALVITDYSLPGRNGAWLLHEAYRRGVLRGDPLIVTAHPRPADATGFTVLHKPVELERFLHQVRSRLAETEAVSAEPFELLFAVEVESSRGLLTAAQREESITIAERAAREASHAGAGLHRRVQGGVAVTYRVDAEARRVVVLEIRPASG